MEFYRIKFYLRDHHSQIHNWSDDRMESLFGCRRRDRNEDISIALIIREQFSTSAALQGHSGNNLIDPTLQDNVLIGAGIFLFTFTTLDAHSNFILLSTIGLVPGGQNLSRRQTVFFLPFDPRDESHRDPERINFSVRRLATIHAPVHGRGIKTRYFWGRYWSCDQRRIDILSNTIECNNSSRNTSSPLYFPKLKD